VDSKGNTATASCSITINATQSCTNNGNLNGNYAFLFQGWSNFSGSGDVLTATAGSRGLRWQRQHHQRTVRPERSRGWAESRDFDRHVLCSREQPGDDDGQRQQRQTTTYAFVLQPNGNGNVIPYDTTTPWDASGIFLKQNTSDFSTSDFTGQYSLGFIGVDNA
jgi:hypothetical protein